MFRQTPWIKALPRLKVAPVDSSSMRLLILPALAAAQECKKTPTLMYSCTITVGNGADVRTYGPYLGEGYTKLAAKARAVSACESMTNVVGYRLTDDDCRKATPVCERGTGYLE